MTRRFCLLGAISGVLCGCSSLPEPYAPPPQRPFFEAPPETARILNMEDADAESHFVRDIGAELQSNTWRWTGKRPTVLLHLRSNQKVMYAIDFAIADSTFQQTGPVTVSLFVNEHLLDRVRCTAPGRQRIHKPIPTQWLGVDEDVTLSAEIDKLWSPPQADSQPLGFILVSLGLEHPSPEGK